ncbi:TRAP transporter large permease [Haloquadratum walsbyi]|jgi:tripartite ATP-independent transporter DctM subunit|uniref:TRAP-type transport system large permease protein n=1 Tax=Haloquadratum walsbyi (strain DSM 16790 / HBSQ001) TaxID=362976 RepID=Q18I67_HALWD|nr:TRAP transporter large permease [Haloquadratum walsbyi]CAJ52310.1 TRAP-type transport system large permease protein [Haloquadratum walsbyi DSM 16790]
MEFLGINAGLVVILGFVLLALLRIPVFISLALPSTVYVLASDRPILFVVNRMVRTVDSFTLLAIPLFIYVGSLMNHGDITEKIFDFADNIVGHLTGGLAQVNIVTSLIFSGISGSALADVGGIGRVLIQTMSDNGYEKDFSAALTSASATIGPIFPPSIPLILYGILAEVSVLQLLIAGAGPAILTTALLMIWTSYIARQRNLPSNDERATLSVVGNSLVIAAPALLTPVVLITGMLGGVFTPTEAAAVTVIYILIINTVIYRVTGFEYLWEAAIETARTTGSIVLILAAAAVFSFVLSVEGIDTIFANFVFSISESPIIILLLVNILLLFIGLFLDPIAALVMMTPIVFPVLFEIGVDPIQIGVIMVFNLMLGLLTPPLGLSVYLSADIADVSVSSVFNQTRTYYAIMIIALLVVTFVPAVSLSIVEMFLR